MPSTAQKLLLLFGGAPPPTVSFSGSLTVAENAAIGTVIGTFVVIGGSGVYTFAFATGGNPGDDFALAGDELETAVALDYETIPSYALVVEADNGVDPVLTLNATITVTDIDEVAPTPTFSPADNATGVAITATLTATFNETVTLGASGVITLKKTSDNSTIDSWDVATDGGSGAGQVEVLTNTALTLHLTASLTNSIEYYVVWDAGVVKDAANNNVAALSVTTTWSFTTVAAAASTLSAILTSLSLTSNLQVALDAGDSASYASGQSWLDTSGNGEDFFRGLTVAATTDDPTFNGTPGALSSAEYWTFDGADLFSYDAASETWMTNVHKDNGVFSAIIWVYLPSSANLGFCGTAYATTNIGFALGASSGSKLFFAMYNGTGTAGLSQPTSASVLNGQWVMLSVSIDEAVGAGGLILGQNASFETFTSTYSSPSALGNTYRLALGARASVVGSSLLPNTSRMAMAAMWSAALTSTNFTDIFNATKGRFGL